MRRVPELDAATIACAERMGKGLRTYHAIGAKVSGMKTPDISRLTGKYGVTPHLLRRILMFGRQFASSELEELSSLRRPNGHPLQWGHVN